MRSVAMLLVVTGLAWSQAIMDATAAIAGGSVGGAAGKKVNDGVSAIFQKVDATAVKAAKAEKPAKTAEKPSGSTVLEVGSGAVIKDHSLVPPPPPPVRRAAVVPPPPPPARPALSVIRQPIPTLPPPPRATADDLKTLASGTARADVLKLGPPASRITMYDDGHLVEIYRYQSRDTTLGVVRLSDGTVSSVQLR